MTSLLVVPKLSRGRFRPRPPVFLPSKKPGPIRIKGALYIYSEDKFYQSCVEKKEKVSKRKNNIMRKLK